MLFGHGGTGAHATSVPAKAVDLDGANDYLSRASDLTGNADGKTFTFSAWVMNANTGADNRIYACSSNTYINLGSSQLEIRAANAASTNILFANIASPLPTQKDTFVHILISVDLSNPVNRHVYVNDVLATVTWSTYTDDNIDWTTSNHSVGANHLGGVKLKGRLASVFLDYTYRDLSVEANRRYFITADRKPTASSATLTGGIIYLPMDDPTTCHINQGTGGNFTLNGTIARSGRGPNQYNTPYSDLDGAADYLSRTTVPTGIADGAQFTAHFVVQPDQVTSTAAIINFSTATTNRFQVITNASGQLQFEGYNAAGTKILDATVTAPTLAVGRNYAVEIACDLTNTSNRSVVVNGAAATVTWATYTNDSIDFNISTTPRYYIGANGTPSLFFNGRLGDVWFNTSYIDLSIASNLAKFVTGTGIDAKPADLGANGEGPSGTAPLIYLPMYGNNAGKNYGTGGDFTVNSGPYTCARGPSEFWGNKADFDGTTGYLSRTSALTGVSDGKVFSFSCYCASDNIAAGDGELISFYSGTSEKLRITINSSGQLSLDAWNAAGTKILAATSAASTFANTATYNINIAVDLANSSNRAVYVNGVAATMTWATYTNADINLNISTTPRYRIGTQGTLATYFDGRMSEFFFTTEYIDFSLEANRLKFRDAFGNPVSLGADGKTPTGTAPAIYMRFDPAAQGTNSGTGGNFTKSGTIADGGQL